jgi:hypothetical protein
MDDHLPTVEEQIAAINDSPTIAETMNRGMGLDPGFTLDKSGLLGEIEEEIDDTVAQSHHAPADPQPGDKP